MAIRHASVDASKFNSAAKLPYELRLKDFELAMQDAYDFLFDINSFLLRRGFQRLDDMLRQAIMSGVLSDMLTASMAKHSRTSQRTGTTTGTPTSLCEGGIRKIRSRRE